MDRNPVVVVQVCWEHEPLVLSVDDRLPEAFQIPIRSGQTVRYVCEPFDERGKVWAPNPPPVHMPPNVLRVVGGEYVEVPRGQPVSGEECGHEHNGIVDTWTGRHHHTPRRSPHQLLNNASLHALRCLRCNPALCHLPSHPLLPRG